MSNKVGQQLHTGVWEHRKLHKDNEGALAK